MLFFKSLSVVSRTKPQTTHSHLIPSSWSCQYIIGNKRLICETILLIDWLLNEIFSQYKGGNLGP